jgi:hypothetical protein
MVAGLFIKLAETCAIRFGRRPHPVCCTDVPLLRKAEGDLTLLSLSFNKERDVLAKAKTG